MNQANISLLLEMAIVALTHATEIQSAIAKAVAEGRDLTDEERDSFRAKAITAINRYDAAANAQP